MNDTLYSSLHLETFSGGEVFSLLFEWCICSKQVQSFNFFSYERFSFTDYSRKLSLSFLCSGLCSGDRNM